MVFTDIAGSTALVNTLGDGYAALLAEHRRMVREIVARRRGFEVDTQGDAFFLVFARASDAIAAAREVIEASDSAGHARVRIGIHTGEPVRVPEGYVGADVHLASRIAASGSGGQILISQQTRELAASEPAIDLGLHRLKDVGEVNLFQIGDGTFPPVRSIGRSNLVPPREPLFGRERELSEVRGMIEAGARLVTLTGVGGIGKTTVATALAAELADRFPDGVWFVDLSPVTDAGSVEPNVAALLGSHGGVADHLRAGAALLVLDNFEHVLAAAPSVAAWLGACPGVVILVTSRASLRLSAEHEYPLSPLDEATAARLFAARARTVVPHFQADDEELRRLCRRLDGLPLAVELAAARVRLMTPDQLLARLGHRLSVLTGGARDLPERQRTLEATIAWSHDLLDPAEQALFVGLAVFSGGWTLEAAETVAEADLDLLESLVSKNLIRFDDGRFSMLETIREFAAARLADLPAADELRRRHAAHYAALAASAAPELTGRNQDRWLELMADDEENLRGALMWCAREGGDAEMGLALAADLVLFWYLRSRPQEGWRWLEPLLTAADAGDSATRTRALWGAGFFLTILTDPRAGDYLLQGLEMARRIDDEAMVARSLDVLGLLALFGNELQRARELLEESIAFARSAGDDWCLADALGTVGSIYPLAGEFDRAQQAGAEGLALARSRGDLQGMRMSLFGLALAARRLGHATAARATGNEGLEISRRLGDDFFASYFLSVLAAVELAQDDADRARQQADEALALARDVGAPLLLVCALEVRAAVARHDADADRAFACLIEAEAVAERGSVPGSFVSEALRLHGLLEADAGNDRAARDKLRAALDLARSVSDPWAERRAADDLARFDARAT
jgi:predicted ATPase